MDTEQFAEAMEALKKILERIGRTISEVATTFQSLIAKMSSNQAVVKKGWGKQHKALFMPYSYIPQVKKNRPYQRRIY